MASPQKPMGAQCQVTERDAKDDRNEDSDILADAHFPLPSGAVILGYAPVSAMRRKLTLAI